jgi:NADH-quinone oxidoreductase subunit L
MPITFAKMVTGWLAISGIPIFAGFFSKDEILYRTFAADKYFPAGEFPGNEILWVVGIITAVMTAIYMTRMMVMTFWGEERFHAKLDDDHSHHDDEHHPLPADFKPHESPAVMTIPLIVLAVLSTIGGLVGIPYALSSLPGVESIVGKDANHFEQVLEPIVTLKKEAVADGAEHAAASEHSAVAESASEENHGGHSPEAIAKERFLAALSVGLAAFGIIVGWILFSKKPLRKLPRILEEKWRIDEIYNGLIVDPLTRLSRQSLWKGFDLGFIDGIVNGAGEAVVSIGGVVRRIQGGFVRAYAAVILIGALVVIGYFIYYGLKLIG